MTLLPQPDKLVVLTEVERRLAEIRTVDEAKHIRDMAEGARVYARSAQLGLEIQNHAAFVKLQAERKAGDLLAKMPRADTSQNAARRKRRTSLDLPSQMYSGPPGSLPPQQSAGRSWRRFASSAWCATTSSTPSTRPGEGLREHHGGSRIVGVRRVLNLPPWWSCRAWCALRPGAR